MPQESVSPQILVQNQYSLLIFGVTTSFRSQNAQSEDLRFAIDVVKVLQRKRVMANTRHAPPFSAHVYRIACALFDSANNYSHLRFWIPRLRSNFPLFKSPQPPLRLATSLVNLS